MNSLIGLLTIAVVTTCALAGKLDFNNCPGSDAGVGTLIEVYCDQFEDWDDIVLKKGNTYDFGLKFKAGLASAGFTPSIFGIISGVKVPWTGLNQNSCTDLVGGNCPLVAGKEYHYKSSIKILSSYPSVSLTFQWGLTATTSTGAKGQNQACFSAPATIKS